MPSRPSRALTGALAAAAVLVAGGAALAAPAVAHGSISWGHVWKKQLEPRADHRYYTKPKARTRFAAKAALGGYYTKAESDGRYAAAGSSYSTAQSDARYAPMPTVVRGGLEVVGYAGGSSAVIGSQIDFGWTFPSAPTVHVIPPGATPPAGCSGTVAAPGAAPGNLCIFERYVGNVALNGFTVCSVDNNCAGFMASAFGANIAVFAGGAGNVDVDGSWAAAPAGAVSGAKTTAARGQAHGGPLGR